MAKIQPIRPDEVSEAAPPPIPDYIISIFNSLIEQKYRRGVARVYVSDVDRAITSSRCYVEQDFDDRWLNVEPLFREAGWRVEFIHGAWNDSFPDYYQFWKS